ncbi:MAG: hypothetical protein EP338_09800 [Bacteroidetes bacterium]|nr:MAG: hypothetical protein EP338_09800 [Bacteroidota bacterium]
MKWYLVYLFTCCVFLLQAQISYEFRAPLPPGGEEVKTVSASLLGSYRNPETGTSMEFTEAGIAMVVVIHSYITKEQVRESSQYEVRNNYLFGVVEGDSVPCILEDEKYYFGIRQHKFLNVGKGNAVLMKLDRSTYLLNFKDGEAYTPSLLSFKNKQMSLSHFDYDSDTKMFEGVVMREIKKGIDFDTHILDPSQKEWKKLSGESLYDKARIFQKQD